ncbi:fructose-bisphosphate aldolase [Candidatus Micrarchaeota archaeon]|nr:fructose-bisphosphate aldolase [Candidatus Micrarchaeota archaeon]
MLGMKEARMKRIFPDKKTVIIALDHGIEHGPRDFNSFNANPKNIISLLAPYADGFILNKGIAQLVRPYLKCPLILKLTGHTTLSPEEVQAPIASVRDGVLLKADAVAATVYFGVKRESEMLSLFGRLQTECTEANIPFLGMMYPRGKKEPSADEIAYAARVGAELGADVVKTYFLNEVSFEEIVRASPVPVVARGGARKGTEETLEMIESVMNAGGAGVAIGRSVWQHKDPKGMLLAIRAVVHKGFSAEKALKFVKSG